MSSSIPWNALIEAARKAARDAYCPYSKFPVGAALLAGDGSVFSAFNIENASYGLSVCAERVALWRALVSGARTFSALVLAAGRDRAVTPCGACRQVLREFCPPTLPLRCVSLTPGARSEGEWTLGQLLPDVFDGDALSQGELQS